MSNQINELFTEENSTGVRKLAGTAELTSLSSTIADAIIRIVESDLENYREPFVASQTDHNDMDKLIAKAYNLSVVDVKFLQDLDDETIDGMLKSQQSKRSRSKGKAMTMDNYRTMLVAAVAENLIRVAAGKVKAAAGVRRTTGNVEFTAEELEELANDQEKLRKEIRNIQSKKSISKSKGIEESSEYWQQLLVAEAQLKSIRTTVVKAEVVDTTKNALSGLLSGVDPTTLKSAELKNLISAIQELAQ